ncbi:N-acetylglucosaminylphosphatidylinositol deacetylase [Sphingopyxis macrogoltabida]|uniref:N-acetylglucosaminylphosphatidylinositol deacetylase n=2 Tax=Sphingopyxis macrogoltabida TaxID=33050 RepID=A0A0N7GT20_SPHMC|nr:N-acetylglucosaminylphosphatidylinositol deacetylase [Sphingopyxis macrogoltabida]
MAEDMMTTLVVVAHPDDEVLGFGATGAKLVTAGERVQPIILCGNVDARGARPGDADLESDMLAANRRLGFDTPVLGSMPNIRMNTVAHIEIVQFIEEQIRRFSPSRIVTHHPSDVNDDHVHVARACAAAARLFQRQPGLRRLQSFSYMEILSSTDWALPGQSELFQPNSFVEIAETIDAKLEALAMYRGVMRPYPHPRSAAAVRGLAAYRGGQSGLDLAESFQTVFRSSI